jgi:hypothetical protein
MNTMFGLLARFPPLARVEENGNVVIAAAETRMWRRLTFIASSLGKIENCNLRLDEKSRWVTQRE